MVLMETPGPRRGPGGRVDHISVSGGRISTSVAWLPGPVAWVVFGATSAATDVAGVLRALRLLLGVPVFRAALRAGAALRADAARPAPLRAGARRAAALRAGALRLAFLAVFFAVFFAVLLPPAFLDAPLRAAFRAVPLRAAAFFAPPPFRADLPLDFRAFATS
jgi:hypothetical protein